MPAIKDRRIQVTRWGDSVQIMLSWWEVGKEKFEDIQTKNFEFHDVETFAKVEQVLNELVGKWSSVFIGKSYTGAISTALDNNPKRFDWMIEKDGESADIFIQSIQGL